MSSATTSSSSNRKKRPAPSSPVAEDDSSAVPVVQVSRDALMDSLPYIDATPEDYEEYAAALIEEGMKTRKSKNQQQQQQQQQQTPVKFRTPVMEQEYQRLLDRSDPGPSSQPAFTLGTARTQPPPKDHCLDVEEWNVAVQQAKVDYEGERARSMTLEVHKDSGAALLWKGLNGTLDQELLSLQQALDQQRQRVEQINLQRSQDQQTAGKQLQILTTRYQIALERRFRLDQATTVLEQEVQPIS